MDKILYDGLNLPYSIEAEQAVLGSVLLDPACLSQVAMLVKPEYFYLAQHKAVFATMLSLDSLQGGRIDPLLVLNALKADKVYDDESGKTYLFELSQTVPTTANVELYANIIKEKHLIRALILVSREIQDNAEDEGKTADELLDNAEQRIYDIRQGRSVSGPVKLADIFPAVYERLGQITSENKKDFLGLSTGFADLDRVISGLNRSDLVLIGARPAMGKTSFVLNVARNIAINNKKVAFFSLEMSREQLAQRVLATEARIETTKMRTGNFSPEEWNILTQASVFLHGCELYFDDTSNITVPEMKARVRRLKNVDCVFVDYLQLMKSSVRTDNRVQEVSEITRSLKLMAKDLNIPVVVAAQLARGTEARGKSHKPQLSDLRESGSIEQDADIVMMLYRKDYYADSDDKAEDLNINVADVLVQKNRHGPTAGIKLNWNPDFTLFSGIAKEYDD
ncbi:MAG: replicative DNA helicase [Oscillospiraceae bacterium]|nr:replicative DNA helicase [Oscillospiraceae bacterium]